MSKQEPVAWTDGKFCLSFAESDVCPIPLYTAPRELSDEEIIQIADGYWLEENYQIIMFVKEILKKANNG